MKRCSAAQPTLRPSIVAPGVIEQTGTYRRIVFGEVFSPSSSVSDRAQAIEQAMKAADIEAEARPDARVPLWEKFVYLAPFAGVTGASRQPIGVVRANPESRRLLFNAFAEVDRCGPCRGRAPARGPARAHRDVR